MALLPLVGAHGEALARSRCCWPPWEQRHRAAMFLPRLRQAMARDVLVLRVTLLQAAAMAVMAIAPNVYVAVPAMVLAGMAWITTANSLSVSAQLALPNWVRARGMSIFQMSIMGATALGAAVWGQVATVTSVHLSLALAALTGVMAMALVHAWRRIATRKKT